MILEKTQEVENIVEGQETEMLTQSVSIDTDKAWIEILHNGQELGISFEHWQSLIHLTNQVGQMFADAVAGKLVQSNDVPTEVPDK